MATLKNNDDVLEVLRKAPRGYIKDLEKKIGKEKVRQLEAVGYIMNAPSEQGYTYQTSPRANQVISNLHAPMSFWDTLSDFYYRYIKRVHFSL